MRRRVFCSALFLFWASPGLGNSVGGVGAALPDGWRAPATETKLPPRNLSSFFSFESTPATLSGQYGKPRGIFGNTPLTFGPKVSALGLPSPFRAGLEAKWDNTWGLGFDVGGLPVTGMMDSKVKLTSYVATARYYPWRGPFYVGLGAGKQNFVGERTEDFSGSPVTVTLTMDSLIVVPQVGWRWVWETGFYLGVEAGVQVSLSTTRSLASNAVSIVQSTTQYQNMVKFTDDQANVLAKIPLPHFAVMQVGYFF